MHLSNILIDYLNEFSIPNNLNSSKSNNLGIDSYEKSKNNIDELIEILLESTPTNVPTQEDLRLWKLFLLSKKIGRDSELFYELNKKIGKKANDKGNKQIAIDIAIQNIRYASLNNDLRSLNKNISLFDKNFELLQLEYDLKKNFFLINYYLQNNKLAEHLDEIKEQLYKLDERIQITDPPVIHYMQGFIQQVYYWELKDYGKLKEVSQHKLDILRSSENNSEKLGLFICNLSIAHLYLGENLLAYQSMKQINDITTSSFHNWSKYQMVQVIVLCHNEKYLEAYNVSIKVTNHKKYKTLRQSIKEEWNIVMANMSILQKLSIITAIDKESRIKKFRLSRFLNDMPSSSKMKDSYNAVIQILHIAHLIVDQKYADAIDRIEALDKYCSRYLRKKEEAYRLHYFTKMILEIPKAGFHKNGVLRKSKKYKEKLISKSIADTRQNIIVEVIPFELLWELLIQSLSIKHFTYKPRDFKIG